MADPVLLNKIDKLFASGVGEYVSLPQLIVVGDQSSGKSSVLEGLIGLPFPRDSELCTRTYATRFLSVGNGSCMIYKSIHGDLD
jgi:hypothetical protein